MRRRRVRRIVPASNADVVGAGIEREGMMQRSRQRHRAVLGMLLGVVGANYLAQIPYYLHVYYFPHGTPPSLSGTILLGLTGVWFLVGYAGLARGRASGYWILLAFLLAEVGFYLKNMVTQVANGYAPFFHLQTRDPVLFVVFGIGYLNLLAGAYFLYYLARHRRTLIADGTRTVV